MKRKGTYKDSMTKLIMKKAKVKHHKASIYTDLETKDKKINKFKLAADSNCMGYAAFLKEEHLGFDLEYA